MSEFYEEYRGKKKRSPEPQPAPKKKRSWGRRLMRFLLKLVGIYLCIMLLITAALWALPASFFAVEPDDMELSLQDGLPAGRANILLLGVDAENKYGTQRSDAILIASIGYDGLRLVSLMRDMVLDIPGHGREKLNAAYAHGGAELVMRTINENFDMNIMRYAEVDFIRLIEMVDTLGGVDMSVTAAEMEQVNANIDLSGRIFSEAGYSRTLLEEYGENVHLNGLQALGYARIRKIDSDYQRTNRQRKLLQAMVTQARKNPIGLIRAAWIALTGMESNISPAEMISLGTKVLVGGKMEQTRLPLEGTFDDNGSSLILQNISQNTAGLYDFLYGDH